MQSISTYHRLPRLLQQLACELEGVRVVADRYGSGFRQTLAEFESRSHWPSERLAAYRDKRLHKFVRHAVLNAPYYKTQGTEYAAALANVRSVSDLGKLDILTKSTVQKRGSEFGSSAAASTRWAHTSGTTGAGLRFRTTRAAIQEQWAVWWRYRHWHGIDFGTWCGYFGGRPIVSPRQRRPPFWCLNHSGKQLLFSAYHLAPENVPFYINGLRRYRPLWLHGYPSILAILAAHILDSGMDLGYQVRWITTGAENLLPHQAQLIKTAFGVVPRQHYGMAEAVANFSECELGRLHVDEDFAAVEFVPAGDSHSFRVIGTNFTNPATPLVRYDTGDLVTLFDGACPCGRPGRVVDRVDGRQEDYVILRNGARVGRLDHIFKDMVRIREAQIHQSRPGELTYRLVRGQGYDSDDERRLLCETYHWLGLETAVQIEYVDHIERPTAGKLRFVISDLREAQLVPQATEQP